MLIVEKMETLPPKREVIPPKSKQLLEKKPTIKRKRGRKPAKDQPQKTMEKPAMQEKAQEVPSTEVPTSVKMGAERQGNNAPAFVESERIQDILSKQKKHRIAIPSTENDKTAVTVGINGYVYNIPRDIEVELPEDVIGILKNAHYTYYVQKKREDGEEGNEMIPQKVQRFAYQTF